MFTWRQLSAIQLLYWINLVSKSSIPVMPNKSKCPNHLSAPGHDFWYVVNEVLTNIDQQFTEKNYCSFRNKLFLLMHLRFSTDSCIEQIKFVLEQALRSV